MNPQLDLHFDGKTYDHARDSGRLSAQLMKVRDLMLDGQWRTLKQIAELTGAPEASVSARLRDLRKPKFGGHKVTARHWENGLFHYKVER